MTFADRIGNAQRGIGPLHLTGMFPGSATPEEWITSDPEATPMEAESGMLLRHGFHPEVVSGEEPRRREPAINDQVLGGIYYPEAATINPYQFVVEMAERAERHGAKFQTTTGAVASRTANNRIRGIQLESGES